MTASLEPPAMPPVEFWEYDRGCRQRDELLAACEVLLPRLCHRWESDPEFGSQNAEWNAAIDRMRAAIAAAKE